MRYEDISDKVALNPEEMFEIKGGYEGNGGFACNSGACSSNIVSMENFCKTAICRSKADESDGPEKPPVDPQPTCILAVKI